MSFRQNFMKNWWRVEVAPIFGVLGVAVGGAAWYVTRLARGPEVVWDRRNNPYPWLHVSQDTNTKMYAVSHEFAKSYSRDRF
ncbi:NADH-ubiquinone reductase complex 1 MLRQ subunit [Syncephalis plumigaleata]|nr:NADH-ubiquinone reductase complex 1 MLRQ subunit [Syncephalis plumigaleata]